MNTNSMNQGLLEEMSNMREKLSELETKLVEIIKTEQLSPAEKQVYNFMQQGLSRKTIAQRLFKSEHTVKQQVKSIRRKLG